MSTYCLIITLINTRTPGIQDANIIIIINYNYCYISFALKDSDSSNFITSNYYMQYIFKQLRCMHHKW